MDETLPKTGIPDSLLIKIFDATGNSRGGNKGFFLFFISYEGVPNCVARPVNVATRLALVNTIENFPDRQASEPLPICSNLYRETGDVEGNNKGYIIFYVNKDGNPVYAGAYQDNATYIALCSVVEDYTSTMYDDEEGSFDD